MLSLISYVLVVLAILAVFGFLLYIAFSDWDLIKGKGNKN